MGTHKSSSEAGHHHHYHQTVKQGKLCRVEDVQGKEDVQGINNPQHRQLAQAA